MPTLTRQPFLVTGCARSATGYTAQLLSASGLSCAHEGLYSPRMTDKDEVYWSADYPGESSWLAAPFVPGFPVELPVLHQVRHPLDVVRSKLRTQFFEVASWYKSFAERVLPELLEGSPVERCLRYWVRWNELTEEAAHTAGRPYRRYRVEALGPDLLVDLCGFVGHPLEKSSAARVLDESARDTNTRGDRAQDTLLSWDDLGSSELVDQARALAQRYGYED